MKFKNDKRVKYNLNDPVIEQGLEIIARKQNSNHSAVVALRYFHDMGLNMKRSTLYALYHRALIKSPKIKSIIKKRHNDRIKQEKHDTAVENNKPMKPSSKNYTIGFAVDFSNNRYPIYAKVNPNRISQLRFYSNHQFYWINNQYQQPTNRGVRTNYQNRPINGTDTK